MATKKKNIKLTFTPTEQDHKNHALCVEKGIKVFPIPFAGGYKICVEWSNGKKKLGEILFPLSDLNWVKKIYEIYGSLSKKMK